MAAWVIWIAHVDVVFFYWTEMYLMSIISLVNISKIGFVCLVSWTLEWWCGLKWHLVAASSVGNGCSLIEQKVEWRKYFVWFLLTFYEVMISFKRAPPTRFVHAWTLHMHFIEIYYINRERGESIRSNCSVVLMGPYVQKMYRTSCQGGTWRRNTNRSSAQMASESRLCVSLMEKHILMGIIPLIKREIE